MRAGRQITRQAGCGICVDMHSHDAKASGVSDATWSEATAYYDEETLVALVTAIATINAWNRFGVTFRLVAGSHRRAGQGA
ncbi:alkylhydroperoxidase AhpD family core domain-containing protein [Haloechinothrix alba]|uniref:Alkylhydroperoxidase AhpD family core domain-containing protein n=1 Tax=Haloechinothrix alba TaxID=664784 RepID=A0A238XF76_9PSEU|nr:hypothetical protein [Haloechinothrix alba]SNR57370.1 alkylhydroperoxidase AhpD family core domain-containing protein [Haloechinothrix alba]